MVLRSAQWVALRTLHRRVTEDGALDGEPIYRAGQVRMVLAPDGKHFIRVVPCPSCDRLRITRRVVTEADLYSGTFSELCENCIPKTVHPMDLSGLDEALSGE